MRIRLRHSSDAGRLLNEQSRCRLPDRPRLYLHKVINGIDLVIHAVTIAMMIKHPKTEPFRIRNVRLVSRLVVAALISGAAPMWAVGDDSAPSDTGQGIGLFILGMAMLSAALAVPVRWALGKVVGSLPAYRTVFLALFALITIPLLVIFAFEAAIN